MNRSSLAIFRSLRHCASAARPHPVPPGLAASARRAPGALAALIAMTATALADEPSAAPPDLSAIISHTPLWAWGVLVLLVLLGLSRTREREVGLVGIVLFPVVIALLWASNFTALPSAGQIAGLALGAMLGLAAGLALEQRYRPAPLGNGRLRLPGEWTSLVVALAIFLTRYVKAVIGATDPALARSDAFVLATTGLTSFFAAMLLTRAALRLRLLLRPALA
jgi:hypothetical protein